MTQFLSVDGGLAHSALSPAFWILSDYDTGYSRVVGEQTGLNLADTAKFTRRLAEKYEVQEVLISGAGVGGLLADLVTDMADGKFAVIALTPDRLAA